MPFRRSGSRFERASSRFVASPLPGQERLPTVPTSTRGFNMKTIRMIALGAAVAVNGGALFAVHAAMVEGVERDRAALNEVQRVVVTARKADIPKEVALKTCPAPQAL